MFGSPFLLLLLPCFVKSLTYLQDESRVVKGIDAEPGQFPYQALVIIRFVDGKAALCGGSLLSDEWVLTAGHCVQDAKSFNITLGAIEFKGQPNDGRIVLTSTDFIRHESYQAGSTTNDIAVIKLPSKVTFSETIQPVTLASGKDNYAQAQVIVSGFGLQKDNGDVAQRLQFVRLKVIRNIECMLIYGPFAIKSANICARGLNGESACHGDSGGPLVLENNDAQVGIVSFGNALGCEKHLPVVYTRVTEFREWIKQKTGV